MNKLAERYGIRPGSIDPNLFQDQAYKDGSFGNPDRSIREQALRHVQESTEIAQHLNSRDLSLWFADGSNDPDTANIQRKRWFEQCLRAS
jgi:L-rhamnose isomerase / sugar isomerase